VGFGAGAYIDKHGRRAGLILTLALMSVETLSIAVVPGRLLQGFSAGVDLGGVSVYLSEIATPGNTGFYVSWQSASQQCAVVFAALIGVVLSSALTKAQMDSFGWRIPLLVGCLIIPFCFYCVGRWRRPMSF
jgi:MFS family permease